MASDQAMTIRLPLELHKALEEAAEAEDLTMAQYIRRTLRRDLARGKKQ